MNGRFALARAGWITASEPRVGRRPRALALALALGLTALVFAGEAGAAPAAAPKAPAKRAAPSAARAHRAAAKPRAPQAPPARASASPTTPAPPPAAPRAAEAPERPAASGAPAAAAAVVKTEEAGAGERTYTFGAQEVEGRLKSPQILYFLRRVRAEFDPAPLGHRSFLLELYDTRRHRALE